MEYSVKAKTIFILIVVVVVVGVAYLLLKPAFGPVANANCWRSIITDEVACYNEFGTPEITPAP
jgi:hypothetical protein